ncbi:MAG: 50S ribosomal protein L18, partial [Candidatus Marinimicrobia bacterium]|nr:50S ribosomal protein L18 [Candidatus Neomarinimicrobiota bacterium]
KINGTPERPRLVIYRSNKHFSAQIIDDTTHKVLVAIDSFSKEMVKELGKMSKTDKSQVLGKRIAELAKGKDITSVVFDRNGFIYHGRIKAFADASREGGLIF